MDNHYKIKCCQCDKEFWRHNRQKKEFKNKNDGQNRTQEFCSIKCSALNKVTSIELNCGWCNNKIIKQIAEYKGSKSGLVFCNRSCSASYNNTKKRKTRRSKCEILLFDLLKEKYLDLELSSNDKNMLDGLEVDIAIPSLNLAIEWNGIVHFKPIYGDEKLSKIKENDLKKQLLAQEKNIRLIIIPDLVSSEKYVREAYNDICKIIDLLL